jgi:integrase
VPVLEKRLTDSLARKLEPPPAGYTMYWCADTPGFGVRVTAAGARAWIMERRVEGDTKRRTLGKAAGRNAISAEAARKLLVLTSSDMQQGRDPLEIRREDQRQEKLDVTLAVALKQYAQEKRRTKDGLPLKERTRADYLSMLRHGEVSESGKPKVDGELAPLANRPLSRIHGDDVRDLYAQLLKRGQRRATYAMQVLRATLKWHGVQLSEDPLGKAVPGRKRIVLRPTSGKPNPIPPERLGSWWRAALQAGRDGNSGDQTSADYLRFLLLTGARGGESGGSTHLDGILVGDVDLGGKRITLRDTKNRRDHTILLSRQALEIVKQHAKGKKVHERLFAVRDPGKTLDAICHAAGVGHRSPHQVRQTFASIAEGLVSAYTLKKMVNHTAAGDVTGTSYISIGEARLREGWQAVADYVEKSGECAIDG